jgi:hypothetical protein
VAVDREVVDLTVVVAMTSLRIPVVAVVAAEREEDGSVSEPTGLALHPHQFALDLHHHVAACVLSERKIEAKPEPLEGRHDCERRSIAFVLGMVDVVMIANRSDSTMGAAPE